MPSDTYFTVAPEWTWYIVLYFFFGGIAGGSYFLAAMLDVFGDESDRPLSRIGYYIAFPAVLVCGPLLIIDLNRPERFWHMLIQSNRIPLPMFKYWSPMSVGAWGLTVFGAFATVSFIGALAEEGKIRWGPIQSLNRGVRRGRLSGVFGLVGAAFGFFLASYTGVLLAVTNRPIWADTTLLGLLFVTSAASTASALMLLLAHRRRDVSPDSIRWLDRLDNRVMLVELVALALVIVSLGSVAREWLSAWGVLLALGVVVTGILLPLALHWRPRLLGGASIPAAAVLALIGGFILRVVVVMSSEGV